MVRVRANIDRCRSDFIEKEVVQEISVCLENTTIDVPNLIGIQPEAGLLRAELAAILVRVLEVDKSEWLSFGNGVSKCGAPECV